MNKDLYNIVNKIYIDPMYKQYNNGNYPLYKWLRIKRDYKFKLGRNKDGKILYVEKDEAIKYNNVLLQNKRNWKNSPCLYF